MNKLKNVKVNLVVATIMEIITIGFALVVPKLMISHYGPEVHGLMSVITSLIGYLNLVEAGISASSVYGLYKPLADDNQTDINAGINAISIFYKGIGIIFSTLVIVTALLYPLINGNQFQYYFVVILIIVSGISQTIEYLFCSKYKILLQADKKLYVLNTINVVAIIFQGILRIVMILSNCNIILVQLIPAVVYLLRLFILKVYVLDKYKYLNSKIPPNFDVCKSKWNVLIHQITNLIVNNTDGIVLSIFVNYIAVSIYSIYNMVISNINGFLNQVLSNAITANFGHLLSKQEISECKRIYENYEKFYYYVVFLIFGICSTVLFPFVKLYVGSVNNIEYANMILVGLFILNAILNNIRIPLMTIVNAAGHFKETQIHAIFEAIINLIMSLLLVRKYGIYGVLIGTTCSYLYRDIMFIIYTNKNILKRSCIYTIRNILIGLAVSIIVLVIGNFVTLFISTNSWINLFLFGCLVSVLSILLLLLYIMLFEKKIFKMLSTMRR